MASRKKKKKGLGAAGDNPSSEKNTRSRYQPQSSYWDQVRAWWPASFAAPKRAAFLTAAWVILSILLCLAAALGSFTAVKESVAGMLQVEMPYQVDQSNFDMAFIIMALSAVILFSLIHPSLGIILILAARSWLDGYTFPLDNLYFVWSIYFIAIIWLVRIFRGREKFLPSAPLMILAALVVYLLATLNFSWQYGRSYPVMWLWVSYLALFAVSLHVTRDVAARKLLVFVFLGAMGVQALFSVLHYEYLLPYLRTIIQNPAVLRRYFNTDVITPDLARRFMVNRAFGTMLFPNTLAGFLVLGIPFSVALCTVHGGSFQQARKAMARRGREPENFRDRALLLSCSILMGMVAFIAFMFISYFPKEYRIVEGPDPWYLSMGPLVLGGIVLASITALTVFTFLRRFRNLSDFWSCIRFPLLIALSGLLIYTLWITYSRGALLALCLASALSVLLYKIQPKHVRRWKRRFGGGASLPLLLSVVALLCLSPLLVASFTSAPSWAQEGAGGAPKAMEVTSEGMAVTTSDLADPTTFGFRLGYWRVAMRVALANWKWGVGLGNFHVAYPQYQFMGAGDVREAHNGFLQFFCETGILGGLLFLGFWAYFFFWGAGRILQQSDPLEKRILAGMYGGILAFLLHAFLDINFSHPSLMMVLFFFCGAFFSRASFALEQPEEAGEEAEEAEEELSIEKPALMPRLVSVVLMVVLVLAAAAEFRLFKQHIALNRLRLFNLSWEDEQRDRLQNAQFYLVEIRQHALARDRGEETQRPPRIPLRMARMLLDDPEVLSTGYMFYRPDPTEPGKFHLIQEGQPIPDNSLAIVRKPWYLFRQAVEAGLNRIDGLIEQDKCFPYSTELALHIAKWYELYTHHVFGKRYRERRSEWKDRYLEWAEIVVERNPHHADLQLFLGNAYLWRGLWSGEEDGDQVRYYLESARACFEEMLRYCPISPNHFLAYAHAHRDMGQWYEKNGDAALAEALLERSAAMTEKAEIVQTQRHASHVYP